jgi:L-amino acid N-acyltransferase YncA
MGIDIVPALPRHWGVMKAIYEEGITTGDATFETSSPSWEQWDHDHFSFGRLIAKTGEELAGWAALSPVSSRCVYAGVGEVSIYVAEKNRGKGVGKRLLQALVRESEAHGIWTLQASILSENSASIHLHENCGFRIVGRRERLGKLLGCWRDVILMERRSQVTGID